MAWYQKNGAYPFEEWIEYKTSGVLPNFPWKQKNGAYPYCEWIEYKEPTVYPGIVWSAKDGEVPHKGWAKNDSYPVTFPYLVWIAKNDIPYKRWNSQAYPVTFPALIWSAKDGDVPHKGWAKSPTIVKADAGLTVFSIVMYDYVQPVIMSDYKCSVVIEEDF